MKIFIPIILSLSFLSSCSSDKDFSLTEGNALINCGGRSRILENDNEEIVNTKVKDLSEFGNHGLIFNRNIRFLQDKEVIKDNPAPHRRYGTMECMYHDDEGIVDNQFQGDVEQTSKNEILYRKKMQKGEVDIDNSGLNSMKYDIHSIDTIYNRHKLINVKFNG